MNWSNTNTLSYNEFFLKKKEPIVFKNLIQWLKFNCLITIYNLFSLANVGKCMFLVTGVNCIVE